MSELSSEIEKRWTGRPYPISDIPQLIRDVEHLLSEIDRLEISEVTKERDLWKSRCENLTKLIRDHMNDHGPCQICKEALAAMDEKEKE